MKEQNDFHMQSAYDEREDGAERIHTSTDANASNAAIRGRHEAQARRSGALIRIAVVGCLFPWVFFGSTDDPTQWGPLASYLVASCFYYWLISRNVIRSVLPYLSATTDVALLSFGVMMTGATTSTLPIIYILIVVAFRLNYGKSVGRFTIGLTLLTYGGMLTLQHLGFLLDGAARPTDLSDKGSAFFILALGLISTYVYLSRALHRIDVYADSERQAIQHSARLQKRLDETVRLEGLGRLAGGIAHDFNNLLTAILGYSHSASDALAPEQTKIKEDLDEVVRAGERASALTAQLLAFSRRQVVHIQTIDLNDAVRQIERMLERLIGEQIVIETLTRDEPLLMDGAPGQLEQVIVNLVVNARDAMLEGGKIRVETGEEVLATTPADGEPIKRPYVFVSVEDEGAGMDTETREHIFEPFFTTKPRDKGTGLGLATVYGIVTQAGGRIDVQSAPGEGSIFKVYFPRVEVARVTAPPLGRHAHHGRETILVVEDEPMVLRITSRILKNEGYTVLTAENGEIARRVSDEESGVIDLLLTDVIMPGISGKDLADGLAEKRPEMRVLFMSGYTDNEIAKEGVLDDEIAFMEKPFTGQQLLRKVRQNLEKG